MLKRTWDAAVQSVEALSPRKVQPYPSPGGYLRLTSEDSEELEAAASARPTWNAAEAARWQVANTSFQVFVFTSMWWCSAILVILQIKEARFGADNVVDNVVVAELFPFPFALTAMIQPATAACAFLLAKMVHSKRAAPPPLQYLSVAGRTMISSMSVLFMMCTARLWGLERLGALRLCSSAFMRLGWILGGLAQCENPHLPGENWFGILMQLTSMCKLASLIPSNEQMATFVWDTNEFLSATTALQAAVAPSLLARVLMVAVGLTAMLYSELKLVSLLSAVAFNVLSTLHQIPIVLAGVVFQHNTVSQSSVAGFTCCIFGALVYALARYNDTH
eukprot:symbB.v1.2.001037.t1/scaffold56.1/size371842/8